MEHDDISKVSEQAVVTVGLEEAFATNTGLASAVKKKTWMLPTLAEAKNDPFALLIISVADRRSVLPEQQQAGPSESVLRDMFRRHAVAPFIVKTPVSDVIAARGREAELDALTTKILPFWMEDIGRLRTVGVADFDFLARNNFHMPRHTNLRGAVQSLHADGFSNAARSRMWNALYNFHEGHKKYLRESEHGRTALILAGF